MRDKEERREHHRKIPVVDSAGDAASVLEKPGLERAEKEDAYEITYGKCGAEQQHEINIQKAKHMQRPENTVQRDPDDGDQHCGMVVIDYDIRTPGFHVIPGELLLAARTSYGGREKAEEHFGGKQKPEDGQNDRVLLKTEQDAFFSVNQPADPQDKENHEKQGSPGKADIMHNHYNGFFILCSGRIFFRIHAYTSQLQNRTRNAGADLIMKMPRRGISAGAELIGIIIPCREKPCKTS
jgi:hypothetical protein